MAKKVEVDLEEVYTLSSKGYNVTMICDAIGISRSYAYSNKDIKDTIKKGASEARKSIVDDLFSRSRNDIGASATIFLSKQLKIFDEYFPTSTPKTPREARNKIGAIYEAVARNELSADKGDKLTRYLEIYVKAYETNELDKQIQEIREELEENKR